MRLVIAGLPPSTNNLYTVVAGRLVISARGRAFHRAMAAVARRAGAKTPDARRYAVRITYHIARDRDVEGSQKALLDSFSGLVWEDDRAVVLLVIRKVSTPPGVLPWTSVILRPLGPTVPAFHAPTTPAGGIFFATSLLPPSTNNAMAVSGGRRRSTREQRAISAAHSAGLLAIAAGMAPWKVSIAVRIRYGFLADRRDVDGSHKSLLDAARGILWDDDRRIEMISLAKGRLPPGTEPLIAVAVWPLR
jgi:Holliday junction resolvase RusA-like endonuclease